MSCRFSLCVLRVSDFSSLRVRKGKPGVNSASSAPLRYEKTGKGKRAGSKCQGHLLSSASINATFMCSCSSLAVFPPVFRMMNSWGRGMPSALREDSQKKRGKNGSQGLGWGSLGAWSAMTGEWSHWAQGWQEMLPVLCFVWLLCQCMSTRSSSCSVIVTGLHL